MRSAGERPRRPSRLKLLLGESHHRRLPSLNDRDEAVDLWENIAEEVTRGLDLGLIEAPLTLALEREPSLVSPDICERGEREKVEVVRGDRPPLFLVTHRLAHEALHCDLGESL